MIKTYYLLTKPGIVMGNVLTTAMGFFLLAQGHYNYSLFMLMTLGLIGVIASGCVFNNYIDREHDVKMERTQKRAFARGVVSVPLALFFAALLGVGGVVLLIFYSTTASVLIALFGFVVYVGLYSFLKYRSIHATLVGSLAGATPPVIGYLTAGGALDLTALYLFILMILWQMPHFFAIAIYRYKDYSRAAIPVLPVAKGIYRTKISIMCYIVVLFLALLLLPLLGLASILCASIACGFALYWFIVGLKGFTKSQDFFWARSMFRVSLIVITAISFLLIFNMHKPGMVL